MWKKVFSKNNRVKPQEMIINPFQELFLQEMPESQNKA